MTIFSPYKMTRARLSSPRQRVALASTSRRTRERVDRRTRASARAERRKGSDLRSRARERRRAATRRARRAERRNRRKATVQPTALGTATRARERGTNGRSEDRVDADRHGAAHGRTAKGVRRDAAKANAVGGGAREGLGPARRRARAKMDRWTRGAAQSSERAG